MIQKQTFVEVASYRSVAANCCIGSLRCRRRIAETTWWGEAMPESDGGCARLVRLRRNRCWRGCWADALFCWQMSFQTIQHVLHPFKQSKTHGVQPITLNRWILRRSSWGNKISSMRKSTAELFGVREIFYANKSQQTCILGQSMACCTGRVWETKPTLRNNLLESEISILRKETYLMLPTTDLSLQSILDCFPTLMHRQHVALDPRSERQKP